MQRATAEIAGPQIPFSGVFQGAFLGQGTASHGHGYRSSSPCVQRTQCPLSWDEGELWRQSSAGPLALPAFPIPAGPAHPSGGGEQGICHPWAAADASPEPGVSCRSRWGFPSQPEAEEIPQDEAPALSSITHLSDHPWSSKPCPNPKGRSLTPIISQLYTSQDTGHVHFREWLLKSQFWELSGYWGMSSIFSWQGFYISRGFVARNIVGMKNIRTAEGEWVFSGWVSSPEIQVV